MKLFKVTKVQLLNFIRNNPGTTNADIAKAFDIPLSDAGNRSGILFDKGLITRQLFRRTPEHRGVYALYYKEPAPLPKAEVTLSVAPSKDDKKSVTFCPSDATLSALIIDSLKCIPPDLRIKVLVAALASHALGDQS